VGAGNVISGNLGDGLFISASRILIQGNLIGTDASGSQALGNVNGLSLSAFAFSNTVGGAEAGAGNLISGNLGDGIVLAGGSNLVQGNRVGADASGTRPLGNRNGMSVSGLNNTIGGTAAGAGNLISGNRNQGLELLAGARDNRVQGNTIGTDVTGTQPLGNVSSGVAISGSNNLIGGTDPGASGVGINFGQGNVVQGNRIGTDVTGTSRLGNGVGVAIAGSNNTVGGTAAGAGNLISGNGNYGIILSQGSGNLVQGNRIGTDASGARALGNLFGVFITGSDNTLGGAGEGARNLISGNGLRAVDIFGAGNRVQGNYIGTDVTGTAAVGNRDGVFITGSNNVIGGTEAGAGNLISGNDNGVYISGGAGNLIQGNRIGTDASGAAPLGNFFGVVVVGPLNTIGGTAPGAGNLISGNRNSGVFVFADGTLVQGNLVGTDGTGARALGNGGDGVTLFSSANTVGGVEAGAGNTIAFNGGAGVGVQGGVGNRIQGNAIHSNSGLGIDLGGNGVTPNDAGDADTGPNQLQNFPVLSVALAGGTTRVAGTVNSSANTTFTLDFYASAAADPSGFGEGARYLGSAVVTTDGSGNARFEVTLAAPTTPGEVVTATATDPAGNTSEFSRAALAFKEVAIDIKPGDAANLINLNSNGVLPVAVLTTPDFDAATVDTSDLSRIRFGDVNGEARVSPLRGALEDVDGDGDLDLILQFSTRAIREAGALTEASTLAELTGFTTGGVPWRGTDSVQVVRGGAGADSVAGPGGFDGLLLAALGTRAAPQEGRALQLGLPVAGQEDEPGWAPCAMPSPGDAGADVPQMLVPDTMRRTSARASSAAWLDLVFTDFPGEDRLLDGAVGPAVS
jgi:hypothetical protein